MPRGQLRRLQSRGLFWKQRKSRSIRILIFIESLSPAKIWLQQASQYRRHEQRLLQRSAADVSVLTTVIRSGHKQMKLRVAISNRLMIASIVAVAVCGLSLWSLVSASATSQQP